MTGSFTGLQRSCQAFVEMFDRYQYLWKLSRSEELEKFLARNPNIDDYEREIEKYERATKELETLPLFRIVGSLSLGTQSIVEALKREISEWKQAYGSKLNELTKGNMKKLVDSMEEKFLSLTRKVYLATSLFLPCD